MKIEDRDIDKLLEEFKPKEIVIPESLDDKLNEKLIEIKPKKQINYSYIKVSVAVALTLFVSYSVVPSFRTFAEDVFKYIFGDIGIENAINNGYKKIDSQTVKIGTYDLEIDNIYIDDLRISFDVVIKNPKDNNEITSYNEYYSLYVNNQEFTDVSWSCTPFDYNEEKEYKSNIELIGSGISRVLENKPNKVNLELELVRNYIIKEDNKDIQKNEVIGTKNIELSIPNNSYESKEILINHKINNGNLEFDINSIDMSPTMMYLNTNGEIKDIGTAMGLYNLRLVSENNKVYKENLSLLGKGNKYSYKQTILPSMYYDDSKYVNVVADGVLITPNYKDIEIGLDDNYPKKIEYFETIMYVENVEYKNGNLSVYIRDNDKVSHTSTSLLDGIADISGGVHHDEKGYNIHRFDFEVDEKDNYIFSLQMVMKYEIPIDVKVDIKN